MSSNATTFFEPSAQFQPIQRPTQIPNCTLWLDAADSSTFVYTSSVITTWADKSPSGWNATATSSNGPTYTGAIGTYYALNFNGVNTFMTTSATIPGNGHTLIAVWNPLLITGSSSGNTNVFRYQVGGAPYVGFPYMNGGTPRGYFTSYDSAAIDFNASLLVENSIATQTTIGVASISSGLQQIYRNGTLQSQNTQALSAGTSAVLTIGSLGGGGSEYFQGSIAEMITYSRQLSQLEQQQVEGYLAWKWNLQDSLPINHPFKYVSMIIPYPLQTVQAPTQIPGCSLWLDAADSSSIAFSSGSNVTRWNDKSGNGWNASNTTAGTYPTYQSNISVQFRSAGTQRLIMPDAFGSAIVSAQRFTAFIIGQRVATGAQEFIGFQNANPNQNLFLGYGSSNTMNIETYSGGGTLTATVPTYSNGEPYYLLEYMNNGVGSFIFRDSTQLASNTSPLALTSLITPQLGVRYYPTGFTTYHDYNISEMIIYTIALTTTQRQQVEGYLAWKWGLQNNLPNDHLFRYTTTFGQLQAVQIPTQISGCSLWLDAADSSSLVLSGSNVTQWNDKSGNAKNATPQLTAPTYSISSVVFAGASVLNTGLLYSNVSSMSYFAVATATSAAKMDIIGVYTATGTAKSGYQVITSNYRQLTTTYDGTIITAAAGTITSNVLFLYDGTLSNAGAAFTYLNGTQTATGTVPTMNNSGSLTIGGLRDPGAPNGAEPYIGTMQEIIVYSGILTSIQRQQVEGYLAWKWGLQGNLPSYQLFKNSTTLGAVPALVPQPPQYQPIQNPTQIPGCTLWLDAADSATRTLSGSNVIQWNDKSGSGWNATSVATSNGPTLSTISGVQSLYFNGSNSFLLSAATVPGNSHTLIGVWNPDTITANTSLFRYQDASYIIFPLQNGGTPTGYNTSFAGFQLLENSVAGQITLGTAAIASGLQQVYRNGVIQSSNTVIFSGRTSATLRIGAFYATPPPAQQFFKGLVGEMISYSRQLLGPERQQIETYLALKWGVQTYPFLSGTLVNPRGPQPTLQILPLQVIQAPTQISGCQLWLDAADSSSLSLSGSNVTQWNDKSGNSRNASAAPSSPTYSNSGLNGLPTIQITPTSGMMCSIGSGTFSSGFCFFVVFQKTGANNGIDTVITRTVAQNPAPFYYYVYLGGRTNFVGNGSGNISGPSIPGTLLQNTTPTLWNVTITGSNNNWIESVNGEVTSYPFSPNYYGDTASTFYIGRRIDGSCVMRGNISEIILYNKSALTTLERQQVEGYLAFKWGLLGNLPITHPFYRPSPLPLRIVKLGTFQPTRYSGCTLWLDAADTSTFNFSSGSNVTQWRDKSGAGNNTTAGAATLTTDSGYQNVYFNGISNYFSNSLAIPSQNHSLIFVHKPFALNVSTSGNLSLLRFQTAGTPYIIFPYCDSTTQRGYITTYDGSPLTFNSSTLVENSVTTAYNLCIANISSGSQEIYKNGTIQSSNNQSLSSGTSPVLVIGREPTIGIQTYKGNVDEIIVYNRALSTAERQQIEGYLAWKWGLQGSLPQSHPFKLFPPPPV